MTRFIALVSLVATLAIAASTGCNSNATPAAAPPAAHEVGSPEPSRTPSNRGSTAGRILPSAVPYSNVRLPSGTPVEVTLNTELSSESATVGNSWSGVTTRDLYANGELIAAAGSPAGGAVTGVAAARRGDRAMLDLGLAWISAGGTRHNVRGSTPAVIAGSTRARNLGAIAAATAAGAVVGHAIGKSDKGTLVGAIVGAGAATGVVSQTKGWQVLLKPGMALTFTTTESLAIRQ